MHRGVERETVAKSKKSKQEDAIKAFAKTPAGKALIKKARKHAKESLDKAVAEATGSFPKSMSEPTSKIEKARGK
jgi:hypothetical protein